MMLRLRHGAASVSPHTGAASSTSISNLLGKPVKLPSSSLSSSSDRRSMVEAAVIIAGFKWLAPFTIELLKKGYSYIGMDADEKLQDLQNVMIPQIEMLIDAAENSPHKDRLRGWLQSLEEAVYEAEDVLDLQDYYLLKQKIKSSAGGITVRRLESSHLIKDLAKTCGVSPQSIKLKKSLMKLEKTAVKAREFRPFLLGVNNNVRGSETANESGRMVTTSRLAHKVFGRDKQRDHIIDLLQETAALEPESSFVKNYSIVAIVHNMSSAITKRKPSILALLCGFMYLRD